MFNETTQSFLSGVVCERLLPRSVVVTCLLFLFRKCLSFVVVVLFSLSLLFHHTSFFFNIWLNGQFVPAVSLPD